MVVDAKDNNAIAFYEGFGFKLLNGMKNRLVLPISIISKLINE